MEPMPHRYPSILDALNPALWLAEPTSCDFDPTTKRHNDNSSEHAKPDRFSQTLAILLVYARSLRPEVRAGRIRANNGTRDVRGHLLSRTAARRRKCNGSQHDARGRFSRADVSIYDK
jgi:hypothetical protein